VAKYGGQLPSDEATLLSFKGIGPTPPARSAASRSAERAAILAQNAFQVRAFASSVATKIAKEATPTGCLSDRGALAEREAADRAAV